MSSILDRLGNNFLVAAFIPALGFVIALQWLFGPTGPSTDERLLIASLQQAIDEGSIDSQSIIEALRSGQLDSDALLRVLETQQLAPEVLIELLNTTLQSPAGDLLEQSLSTLVLTLLVGFTLMGLNTFIYKLLEGYFVLERIPALRRRQYRRAAKRTLEYKALDRMTARIRRAHENETDPERMEELKLLSQLSHQLSRDRKAQYKQDYPTQLAGVLPTRFGNIFKSWEQYANENYGIDSVTIWPRLIHAIDREYYKLLDESNNSLAFVVNCMALSFVLSILCFFATVAHLPFLHLPGLAFMFPREAGFYLLSGVLLLALSYFFYLASFPPARQYGNLVRSAFELFRFDLLQQLHLKLPARENEEFEFWVNLSDFMAMANLENRNHRREFGFQHLHTQQESKASPSVDSAANDEGPSKA